MRKWENPLGQTWDAVHSKRSDRILSTIINNILIKKIFDGFAFPSNWPYRYTAAMIQFTTKSAGTISGLRESFVRTTDKTPVPRANKKPVGPFILSIQA